MSARIALGLLVPAGFVAACSLLNEFSEVPADPPASSSSASNSSSASAGGAAGGGGDGGACGNNGGAGPVCAPAGVTGSGAGPRDCSLDHIYGNIFQGTCDLLAQDCPPGQGCVVVDSGSSFTTECQAESGNAGDEGSDCSVDADCRVGLVCYDSSCSPVCCFDSQEPCGPVGELCGGCVYSEFGDYGLSICFYSEPCALLATPDSCPGVDRCTLFSDSSLATCVQPHTPLANDGGACTFLAGCADGMTCHIDTCRYVCKLDGCSTVPGEGGCPPGQACSDQGVDLPNIGICQPL